MYYNETRVAIVDYGLGNLFSVKHACRHVGLQAEITDCPEELGRADAILLPGVGAYGDAMEALRRRKLDQAIRTAARAGTPTFGICLGLQLFMSRSFEFGEHEGLGLIEGDVVRFESPERAGHILKVPQVGWNRIHAPVDRPAAWSGTPLEEVGEGEFMYFVHSFYVRPHDTRLVLSTSQYGHIEFASSVRLGNVFGFQFHPERSGEPGLAIYRSMLKQIREGSQTEGVTV